MVQEAREAQPEQPLKRTRSLVRRAAEQWHHLLRRLGKGVVARPGGARGYDA